MCQGSPIQQLVIFSTLWKSRHFPVLSPLSASESQISKDPKLGNSETTEKYDWGHNKMSEIFHFSVFTLKPDTKQKLWNVFLKSIHHPQYTQNPLFPEAVDLQYIILMPFLSAVLPSGMLCRFASTAVKKHHRQSGLNNRNVLSHSSLAKSRKSGCREGWFPLSLRERMFPRPLSRAVDGCPLPMALHFVFHLFLCPNCPCL